MRGKPVVDALLERLAPADEIRVVVRPAKHDLIEQLRGRVTLVEGEPRTVAESLVLGLDGLAADDLVLAGFPDTLFGAEQVFERLLAALGPRDVALGVFRFAEPSRSDVLELDGAAVTRVHVRPQQPASNLVWGCFAARRSALDGIEVSMSRANSSTGSPVPAAWPRSTSRPSSSTSALRSRCRRRREGPRHRPPRLHRLGGRAVPCRARHEVTGVGTHYYPAATCTPAPRSRACSATSAISARTTCAATTRSSTWPLSPTDPLDDLDPELTFEINERASVRLARAAREAGVGRFIFASVVLDVRRLGRGVRHRAGPAQPGHALPADRAHRGHRAHRGRRARSATRGAKAALLNLTETLAAETAGKGLVVFRDQPGLRAHGDAPA